MKRPESSAFWLLLAVITTVLLASAPSWAQDPFQAPSAEASTSEKGRDASASDAKAQKKVKEPDRVIKTNEEWQKLLSPEEFMVTRMKATEPAFSGKYASGHFKGTFLCVCCGARLLDARHKFESGTGWPSFWSPVSRQALETAWDYSEPQEARVEVSCRRCGAHLGHVFQDGPPPTGLRYCINSLAIKLDSEKARPAGATASGRKSSSRTHATRATRKTTPRTGGPSASTASKSDGGSGQDP
jgi:peptide-methionine (R)-S-oxide reductase